MRRFCRRCFRRGGTARFKSRRSGGHGSKWCGGTGGYFSVSLPLLLSVADHHPHGCLPPSCQRMLGRYCWHLPFYRLRVESVGDEFCCLAVRQVALANTGRAKKCHPLLRQVTQSGRIAHLEGQVTYPQRDLGLPQPAANGEDDKHSAGQRDKGCYGVANANGSSFLCWRHEGLDASCSGIVLVVSKHAEYSVVHMGDEAVARRLTGQPHVFARSFAAPEWWW
mmetsp:Transcript_82408/g.164271  ORF Transcript_82408/g.164271 Transcript_82408/m.164271 type:complete len:223 (-) Transcript_82408:58-726(-)